MDDDIVIKHPAIFNNNIGEFQIKIKKISKFSTNFQFWREIWSFAWTILSSTRMFLDGENGKLQKTSTMFKSIQIFAMVQVLLLLDKERLCELQF